MNDWEWMMPVKAGTTDIATGMRRSAPDTAGFMVELSLISLVLLAFVVPVAPSGKVLADCLPSLPCLFERLTGLPCPFCGMTRAFSCMGALRITEALGYSPGGCVLFVLGCSYALGGWVSLSADLGFHESRFFRCRFALVGTTVLALWIIKLVP